MPRKSKLTKELIKNASDLIKLGNYTNVVCQYLGINESTWYKWLKEGEKANSGLKREFFKSIKSAESQAEIRNVGRIQNAAQDTWQAAAWYLERKFPERWGRLTNAQIKKIEAEIETLKAKTEELKARANSEGLGEERIIIINDKEAMRREWEEMQKHEDKDD